MRFDAIRHDASTYMHGRIVTYRNAAHEKRIRVGRALYSYDTLTMPMTTFCLSLSHQVL